MLDLLPFNLLEEGNRRGRNEGEDEYGEGEDVEDLLHRMRLYPLPIGDGNEKTEDEERQISARNEPSRSKQQLIPGRTEEEERDNTDGVDGYRKKRKNVSGGQTHGHIEAGDDF